jgi:signal transduction histidine kinase
MRRSLTTIPNIGFGIALAVLVGSALLSYSNDRSVAEIAESRRLAFARLDLLKEFLAAALDVETGERGYVITGNPVFLEPFHAGIQQLASLLQRLRAALVDNLSQQPALAALEEATPHLVRHNGNVVSLKMLKDDDAAKREVATGRGKQIMDKVRHLVADLSREDHEQVKLRDQEFQAGLRWRVLIIVIGCCFGFAAVALAAVTINRSLRERMRLNVVLQQLLAENSQMLDRLRAGAADLTRSNKELEQFAYVASHDLQEPLRKVSSFAQLLAARYQGKLDADADEFISYMVDGARRMQILIQNLLAYSRLGRKGQAHAPIEANDVLKQALANLQGAIDESGAVITCDSLPTVLGDESQLVQLFQNLIGNAIKFRGAEKPSIEVRVEPTGQTWTFAVRDNGIGIDPQFAERIFVIFQRLHSQAEYPGTGIGLAFCKKIVERHGGRIWLEPQVGQGATFCLSLPRSPESPEATNARTNVKSAACI